jgi:hypothetical protein
MNTEAILYLIVTVLIGVGVFLILRGFWLWYWKISAITRNQERIIGELQSIRKALNGEEPESARDASEASGSDPTEEQKKDMWKCPECGTWNHELAASCGKCGKGR